MGRPHRCKGNERKRILGGGVLLCCPPRPGGGCWREGHYSSYLIVHHGSSSDFQEGMVWGGVTIAECGSVRGLNSGDLQMDFWGGGNHRQSSYLIVRQVQQSGSQEGGVGAGSPFPDLRVTRSHVGGLQLDLPLGEGYPYVSPSDSRGGGHDFAH